MRDYENIHRNTSDQSVRLPRLFSLCPTPSLRFRYININPNALAAFAKIRLPKSFEDKTTMFNQVFDLSPLRFHQMPNKFVFNNLIRSDGFGADVVLCKKIPVDCAEEEDFPVLSSTAINYDPDQHSLISVDPGRNQVFTAAYGHGDEDHEVRRVSTKEYTI